jgi:hypothetical protein
MFNRLHSDGVGNIRDFIPLGAYGSSSPKEHMGHEHLALG